MFGIYEVGRSVLNLSYIKYYECKGIPGLATKIVDTGNIL
jgi:hypothetical protein